MQRIYEQYYLPFFKELPTSDPYTYYTELIDVIVAEKVSVVSFHFGVPESDVVECFHSHGIRTMATATCTREATLIEQRGVDIVVAQGIEAGGNRGYFTKGMFPQVGLVSLVPQIVDAVKLPVVAAGGLTEGRSAAAAFTMGAQAVQLGSFFLRSVESGAPVSYKNAVAKSTDTSTVLTRIWSGRYGRCIDNRTVHEIKEAEIYPSPLQNYLTNKLRLHGRKIDDAEIQSLWAGQSARYAAEDTTSNLLNALITETEFRLTHLPFGDALFSGRP